MISVIRYHDISCGHRVVGHEGKCQHLHGHNYRIHFKVEAESLDPLGRVVDFSVIKATLCEWLETEWDHKMLLWVNDPLLPGIQALDASVVIVPFNPTAENLGDYLLYSVAPKLLRGLPVRCVAVQIDETRKCSAIVEIPRSK